MKLIGITGGIGMGKSTCLDILHRWGVPVIDTDVVARDLVQPGTPALAEIRAAFGDQVMGPGQNLRREALAEIVFQNPERRSLLESILHPRIRAAWREQAAAWAAERQTAGAVAIPLLFETGAGGEFAVTLCVACTAATQLERLAPRGWPDGEVVRRAAAQWSVERKMAAASHVIWTEGGRDNTGAQLCRVLSHHGVLRAAGASGPSDGA